MRHHQTPAGRTGVTLVSLPDCCAPQIKLTALVGKKTLIQPLATLSKQLSLEPSEATVNSVAGYFASAKILEDHINMCREEIGKRTAIIVERLKNKEIKYYPVCHAGFVWIKLRHRRVSLRFRAFAICVCVESWSLRVRHLKMSRARVEFASLLNVDSSILAEGDGRDCQALSTDPFADQEDSI